MQCVAGAEQVMELKVLQGLLVCGFSLLKGLCFGFSFSLTCLS